MDQPFKDCSEESAINLQRERDLETIGQGEEERDKVPFLRVCPFAENVQSRPPINQGDQLMSSKNRRSSSTNFDLRDLQGSFDPLLTEHLSSQLKQLTPEPVNQIEQKQKRLNMKELEAAIEDIEDLESEKCKEKKAPRLRKKPQLKKMVYQNKKGKKYERKKTQPFLSKRDETEESSYVKKDASKNSTLVTPKLVKSFSTWNESDQFQRKIPVGKHQTINKNIEKLKEQQKGNSEAENGEKKIKTFFDLSENQRRSYGKEETEESLRKEIRGRVQESMWRKLEHLLGKIEEFSQNKYQAREEIIRRIESVISQTFPGEEIELEPYGSYVTKLLTPWSDVDLSIQSPHELDVIRIREMLGLLSNNFDLCNFVTKNQAILQASIPVLKIQADPSIPYEDHSVADHSQSLKFDIIVDNQNKAKFLSPQHRTTEYIIKCKENFPSFYKSILLLKFLFSKNKLNNSYTGGLNAYGLCVLLVAFMGSKNLTQEKQSHKIFFGFIHFLCNEFNQFRYMVDVGYQNNNLREPFQKRSHYGEQLIIMDPSSFQNINVTSTCQSLHQVTHLLQKILNFQNKIEKRVYEEVRDQVYCINIEGIGERVEEQLETFSPEFLYQEIFGEEFTFNQF